MKIEIRDLLSFKFLAQLSLSDDGKQAYFVAATCNDEEYGYNRNLYSYDLESKKTTQLTYQGDCSTYVLMKNGIIFPSGTRDKKEGKTTLYLLPYQGGEAQPIMTLDYSIGSIKKIDDENLAFSSKFDHNKAVMGEMSPKEQKEFKDYIIIDELPFWFNGQGYINKTRNLLYTCNLPTKDVTLVSDKWSELGFYNIQNGKILYSCSKYMDKKPKTSELWEYDVASGEGKKLVAGGKYKIENAGYAFGKTIAFLSDMESYGVGQIPYIYSLEQDGEKVFFKPEYGFGSAVGSDCRIGGGKSTVFTQDAIYYLTTIHTDSQLHKLDKSGNVTVLVNKEGSVDMFDVAQEKVVYIGMHGQELQELYDLNGQLTTVNKEALKGKDVVKPEKFDIVSDGVTINGFIMKPVDFDPTKTYPGVTNVHGGPRSVYGSVYMHEMQVWANKGYFVFFSNPRGSDGRGEEFADLRGKYGTIDYDDFMRFTDAVLEKYPQIDVKALGITGGSYGGFMTNWAIGNTDRFAAAVSQRSLTNWISLTNLADIGYAFDAEQVCGTAWDNMQKIWDQSPLKHANKAKTPTLFIHSEEDYRCLLSEGMQMFYAIKNAGCVAKMFIFKGENHELSRSGKPIHRLRRLTEITNWFEKYLKQER